MTLIFIFVLLLVLAFLLRLIPVLWRRHYRKKLAKKFGLTPEEFELMMQESRRGDDAAVLQRLEDAQERARSKFERATGIDARTLIPEIGIEISWADIVRHVFRICNFDRSDTTIGPNYQVQAKSLYRPYGYLLVESPIFNQRVRLPIIHRDDFILVAKVFDEPDISILINEADILVTYAPKHLLPKGLSGSPHHVLHYVVAPRGTLDNYYSVNNDIHRDYAVGLSV